jgi:ABC-type glycerol-3-phosphate transport system substrate-binding protein
MSQTNKSRAKVRVTLLLCILLFSSFTFSGCRKKCTEGSAIYPECLGKEEAKIEKPTITLTIWNLYDSPDIFAGAIQRFKTKKKDEMKLRIQYKTFQNEERYEEILINAIAEDKGPDIFALHHSWIPRHIHKIEPMPEPSERGGMTPEMFRDTFYKVAAKILIQYDTETRLERVYGVPLYIDTLALYYNKKLFRLLLEKPKPAETWEEIKSQVVKITQPDKSSLEGFERTGIAMGRSDNIHYAIDILSLLFLQYKGILVDMEKKKVNLSRDKGIQQALELFKSFEVGSVFRQENWNQFITGVQPDKKEFGVFVREKTAMIFGYSTTYEDLKDIIEEAKKKRGDTVIKESDIGIIEVPQLFSKEEENEKNVSLHLANFYPLTVSKKSAHTDLAWEFLYDISTDQENFLKEYNNFLHKPSAIRRGKLSEEQMRDKLYGPFARQIPTSDVLPIIDKSIFERVFSVAMENFRRKGKEQVLKTAEKQMQCSVDQLFGKAKIIDQNCLNVSK